MNSLIEQATAIRAAMDTVTQQLSDEQAEQVTQLYYPWQPGVQYASGDRRRYADLLYRCVQPHTSQADWTPDAAPALWVRTSADEWPIWVQPSGAHDAYAMGAKVTHAAKRWTSDIDANVWEPGVNGWTEVQQ